MRSKRSSKVENGIDGSLPSRFKLESKSVRVLTARQAAMLEEMPYMRMLTGICNESELAKEKGSMASDCFLPNRRSY